MEWKEVVRRRGELADGGMQRHGGGGGGWWVEALGDMAGVGGYFVVV